MTAHASTAADVKASYERIAHPPEGVVSARQVELCRDRGDRYARCAHRRLPPANGRKRRCWPISPRRGIASTARRSSTEDPLFPKTHILGSGPFTFVEHVKGDHWTGKRFDKYFQPGKPYLDGYRADFVAGAKVDRRHRAAATSWREFRSITPTERDSLVESLGDKVDVGETRGSSI